MALPASIEVSKLNPINARHFSIWHFFLTFFLGILLSACSVIEPPVEQNLKGGITPQAKTENQKELISEPKWVNEMLASVNSVRSLNKVASITLCSTLMKTAQDYADLMLRDHHYDHTGPNGSSPSDRALDAGYDWRNPEKPNPSGLIYEGISENIAKGYQSVFMVMDGWVHSPGHFKNIIDPDVLHVGFGFAKSSLSESDTYWVQNFGFGGTCR